MSNLKILMPTHNDWPSVLSLLDRIDSLLEDVGDRATVLVVDDASTKIERETALEPYRNIDAVDVLCLTNNLGNQRTIAIGIGYLAHNMSFDFLVVMDSDHEDDPSYLPELVRRCRASNEPVFAERSRRSEGLLFTISYRTYQAVYRALVGQRMSIGNYSVVPAHLVRPIAHLSGLWMQYPSTIMRERLPFQKLPTTRGQRIDGESTMRFSTLVVHGFMGLAVFADIVSARLMISFCLFLFAVMAATAAIGYVHVTGHIDPSWFIGALLIFVTLFIQFSIMAIVLLLVTLISRLAQPIIPFRDHNLYVRQIVSLDDFIR